MRAPASDTWIVGLGEARTAPALDDVSINELAWEAIAPALGEAGVTLPEVTGAVTASQDFWDGRTISSMNVNEVACGAYGSEAKVAADGAQAVAYACARIDDGDQHLNVVVAHAKESEGDAHTIELAAFDPFYERQIGVDDTVVAAFQAARLYARPGASAELSARIVAASRARSQVLEAVSVEQVLSAPPTATPAAAARSRSADGRRLRDGGLLRRHAAAPRSPRRPHRRHGDRGGRVLARAGRPRRGARRPAPRSPRRSSAPVGASAISTSSRWPRRSPTST